MRNGLALAAGLPCSAGASTETVTVAPGRIEVVVARKCPSTVVFAAQEMTNFLSRALCAAIPVSNRPKDRAHIVGIDENIPRLVEGMNGKVAPALTELRMPALDRSFAPAKRLRRYGAEERGLSAERLLEGYVADRLNMYPGAKADCIRRDYWYTICQGRDDIAWYLGQALKAGRKTPVDAEKLAKNLGYADRYASGAKDPELLRRYVDFWRKSLSPRERSL